MSEYFGNVAPNNDPHSDNRYTTKMTVILKVVDSAVVQGRVSKFIQVSLMHCSLLESLGTIEGHLDVWNGL